MSPVKLPRSRPPPAIERPIFFIGMPRSGTTVIFEAFSAHPELAWFSQYFNRLPRFPSVALLSRIVDLDPRLRRRTEASDRGRRPWNDLRVGPSEAVLAWRHYCGTRFPDDFLIDERAPAAERRRLQATVSKLLRYQGKQRFVAKVTGPPRIGYLTSLFDDALFIHVIRDGRAVVQSLMRVPFWKDTFRLREPAWRNGLTDGELERWMRLGHSPIALAALEWGAVIRTARREAERLPDGRYQEVRYEDFVSDPHETLDRLLSFCALRRSAYPHEILDSGFSLRDMNRQWRDRLGADELRALDEAIGDLLVEIGYPPDPGHAPVDRAS